MHTIIGVDVGTTHIKSILFAADGTILREEKAQTPLDTDAYGSVYRPEEIWRIVSGQLEAHCHAGYGLPDGVSITGMAEAGLIVDRSSGCEATQILPWFEKRTAGLAAGMGEEKEAGRFAKTGLHNSFKYGIYKFIWLLEHGGPKRENAVWLSMCDYVAWKLTGRFVTDPSFAARTYAYNIAEGCWDREWLAEHGLSPSNFPEVVPSGKAAGIWNREEGKIPVAVAGHDHVCAAFGLLREEPEGICDSMGTSETYVGRVKVLPEGGFDAKAGALYGPFVDGGWFYMASVPSSGHSLEWFRKTLQLSPLSYEELNGRTQAWESGPTGLLYFPYLTGMGSPWYEGSMRGALLGFGETDDGMRVCKAVMEGIQYQAAWVLSLLDTVHGTENKDLVCAGGAVKNRALMQIKADILNRNVKVPRQGEATLCGAAALFYKKNIGRDVDIQFLRTALPPGECYQPKKGTADAYRRVFTKNYLPLVEVLRKYYDRNEM